MKLHENVDEEDIASQTILDSPISMILADPRLDDNPITYVNRAFEALTLYSRDQALGRNCRFLQGPQTDPADVARIRDGLRSGEEFQVTITNHKADGTPFRNQLIIAPVHDKDRQLVAFLGIHREVSDVAGQDVANDENLDLLLELQHRVKNHLAMIVSMIRIQASREVTPKSLKAVSRRIEALALLYEELLRGNGQGDGARQIAAGAYLRRIASVVSGLEPYSAIRTRIECEDIMLPVDHAARLGLLLSEFLTNALQHAFRGRSDGLVEVEFFRLSEGRVRLCVRDDGVGMPEGSHWPFGAASIEAQHERAEQDTGRLDTTGHGSEPGVGGSIVVALTESLDASLAVTRQKQGTMVTVDFDPVP